MELKVWVDGLQRVVCGLAPATTCQDIIYALAHATGQTGRFVLVEEWRSSERSLSPLDRPLELLAKWGEHSADVKFVLKHVDTTFGVVAPRDRSFDRSAESADVSLSSIRSLHTADLERSRTPTAATDASRARPRSAQRPPPPSYAEAIVRRQSPASASPAASSTGDVDTVAPLSSMSHAQLVRYVAAQEAQLNYQKTKADALDTEWQSLTAKDRNSVRDLETMTRGIQQLDARNAEFKRLLAELQSEDLEARLAESKRTSTAYEEEERQVAARLAALENQLNAQRDEAERVQAEMAKSEESLPTDCLGQTDSHRPCKENSLVKKVPAVFA